MTFRERQPYPYAEYHKSKPQSTDAKAGSYDVREWGPGIDPTPILIGQLRLHERNALLRAHNQPAVQFGRVVVSEVRGFRRIITSQCTWVVLDADNVRR